MRTDAFLAYLDRKDYDTVMQRIMNQARAKKLLELKQSRLFQNLSRVRLHRLELEVIILRLRLNQIIYKEGDEADGIYLVSKGSIKYQKAIEIEE